MRKSESIQTMAVVACTKSICVSLDPDAVQVLPKLTGVDVLSRSLASRVAPKQIAPL